MEKDVDTEYETCYVCDGTGMDLGYNGEPIICIKCHGDTVIPIDEEE